MKLPIFTMLLGLSFVATGTEHTIQKGVDPVPSTRLRSDYGGYRSPSRIISTEFCSYPSAYLCDFTLNEKVSSAQNSNRDYQTLLENAEREPEVSKFLSKNDVENCFELKEASYNTCEMMKRKSIKTKVFTEERKQTAISLFERAKKSYIQFLEHRLELLGALGIPNAEYELKLIIARIRKVPLYFGSGNSENTFNAFAARPKAGTWASSEGNDGRVYLDGAIMLADENPESLYWIILHELGHQAGPALDSKDFSNHPFQKEIACLRRADSVAAKKGDADCWERVADTLEGKEPDKAEEIRKYAKKIQENPDYHFSVPSSIPEGSEVCQSPQIHECFADWMATEIYAREEKSIAQVPEGFRSRRDPSGSLTWIEPNEAPSYSKISDLVAFFCNEGQIPGDSHASGKDRINKIMLVHPVLRRSLGCSTEETNILDTLGEPVSDMFPPYCGNRLYGPLRFKK